MEEASSGIKYCFDDSRVPANPYTVSMICSRECVHCTVLFWREYRPVSYRSNAIVCILCWSSISEYHGPVLFTDCSAVQIIKQYILCLVLLSVDWQIILDSHGPHGTHSAELHTILASILRQLVIKDIIIYYIQWHVCDRIQRKVSFY